MSESESPTEQGKSERRYNQEHYDMLLAVGKPFRDWLSDNPDGTWEDFKEAQPDAAELS